jgi:hypothetical protein
MLAFQNHGFNPSGISNMVKIVANNTIEIGGKKIVLPCSIAGYHRNNPSVVVKDGLIIVNFYPYTEVEDKALGGIDMERNIWAYDSIGNLVWKVFPPIIRPNNSNPYTSVFERDGKVFGGNWCGYDFEINLNDGTVTLPQNPGRPW